MRRLVVVAVVGLIAGCATVPSMLALIFEVGGGFGFTPTFLGVLGYALLLLLWPALTVGVGLWLNRVWIALSAYGVGAAIALVVMGIFA